ncbi:hypothetical protein BN1086_04848 [Citrobacter koseri]|uniref:Uncharacterized protein n=1 Tax=Citrobacter koseri TaxID=545 RepID=A0A078LMN2_CITKO|nr:hypothetical protein BN1086_04848 [Citrobacter koseri]
MTAETAATMRAMAVAADLDLPRYLLAGEIQRLLDDVPDLRQRGRGRPVRGERISRAVALPDPHYPRSDNCNK